MDGDNIQWMVITYEVSFLAMDVLYNASREKAPKIGQFREGTRVCYSLDVIQFDNAQCGVCLVQ